MTTDERPGARRYIEQDIEEIGQKGDVLFEKLRDLVWKDNEGKFISIHVDTGEYAIARSASDASRAVRAGHPPDGRLYVRRLSDEPDWALYFRVTGFFEALRNARVAERRQEAGQE